MIGAEIEPGKKAENRPARMDGRSALLRAYKSVAVWNFSVVEREQAE
jgi:hypothetical protein